MITNVLCIDTQSQTLSRTLCQLEHIGCSAIGVHSVFAALKLIEVSQPQFILIALDIPQSDIHAFLNEHSKASNIPLIALAKQSDSQSIINEYKYGHYFTETLSYPFIEADLKAIFGRLVSTD